jgi:hypothetical protein
MYEMSQRHPVWAAENHVKLVTVYLNHLHLFSSLCFFAKRTLNLKNNQKNIILMKQIFVESHSNFLSLIHGKFSQVSRFFKN